jgi:hypothetical protein
MREQLAKRYRSLMLGEATSMAVFTLLFIWRLADDGWQWRDWLLRGYGLLAILLILAQGTYLWFYKRRTLQQGQSDVDEDMAKRLRTFRTFNWVMLAFYLPFIGIVYWLNGELHFPDIFYGTFLTIFALLEQINYYYYQLMYDNRADLAYLFHHKRLKKGFVARELGR